MGKLPYKSAHGKSYLDLDVSQQHFAYNDNFRYVLEFSAVGDFDGNRSIQSRYVDGRQYCSDRFCMITNENGQAVAVKVNRGSPVDVLMNAKGQPIESY